ncbi:MFS transporter [Microbacterium sp. B2969]|uniref:MFS transporter n=1 Tax=Microbacterium alkaliflavum TaxID=3248839 RepID=A0ABW7QCU2_9MICO
MSENTVKVRVPGRVWRTAWLGGMASWIDAGVLVSSGVAFTFYIEALGLTAWDIGALSALITAGLAVGALVGGPLGDRFGRKRVFSIDLLVLIVGLALLTFAPSVGFLYAGAVVTGLAMGADLPVSLALVAEETPEQFRGRMVGFSQILWGCGTIGVIVLSNVVTFSGMSLELGARIIFGHLLVIAAITWLLRQTLPESREWVASTASIPTQTTPGHAVQTGLRALKGFWPAVIALALFYAIGNIANNTGGQFSFFIITQVGGASPQVATLVLTGFIPLGLITGFIFIRFADTKYRIPVFVFGGILTVAGMWIAAASGLSLVPYIAGLFIGAFGSGLGGEALFKVWTQEKFPTRSRATAQGLGIFICRGAAAIVAVFTPALAAANATALYWGLGVLNLVSLLIGFFWVRRLRDVRMLRDQADEDAFGVTEAHATAPTTVA